MAFRSKHDSAQQWNVVGVCDNCCQQWMTSFDVLAWQHVKPRGCGIEYLKVNKAEKVVRRRENTIIKTPVEFHRDYEKYQIGFSRPRHFAKCFTHSTHFILGRKYQRSAFLDFCDGTRIFLHIILYRTWHNESINDDKKSDLHTLSSSLTRSVYVLLLMSQSVADDVTM